MQEYRNEVPFLSPGDLPDPGIKPKSPALQVDFFFFFFFLPSEPQGNPMFRRGRAKFQTVSRKTMVKNKLVWWENKEPDKN